MNEEDKFDVVVDVLTKHRDKLWDMTKRNMDSDMFNIMDQIRLEHIDELEDCIALWKKYKETKNA